MKVKNIMFSGFMAAILTGVACSADAAGFQVASKQYVDARDEAIVAAQEAIVATQEAVDAKQDEDIAKKEDSANKVETEEEYEALSELDDRTKLYTSVAVAEAIAQSIATSATTDVIGRVDTLETTVGDAESGLVKKVADLEAADTAMDGRVGTLETTVGDAESGLVKDVADLKAADTAMGGRVGTLETDVDALETTVGDAESGLVKDVADLKTNKQDVLTADSYIDADALAENKVKVVVDGQIAADNTGIVTGDAVYKYALPTPPDECLNTTCVLTTNQNGAPYWMQLWLPSDQEETPENGSDV